MLRKIEKYYTMNINFFFISYSVIYAKYNYCYEVSSEQPLRYFDGKEWKVLKPRHNMRTKAPRNSNISVDLDWAELIKEIKGSEFEETTTEMPRSDVSKTDTPTATKATTKRLNTNKPITKRENTKQFISKRANTNKPITKRENTKQFINKRTNTNKLIIKRENTKQFINKRTNTNKLITKRENTKQPLIKRTNTKKLTIKTTPKIIKKLLRRKTKPTRTTTAKDSPQHCRPLCKLKLKSTTVGDCLLQLKTTPGDWRDNWNSMRPTKEHCLITSKKFTLKTTKEFVLQTIKNVSVTTTSKPTTTTKRSVETTRKSTMTTKRPVTITKKPLINMEMPVNCSGNQEDDANSPANWSNLLKEFLKFVELKKCRRPPCEPVTATTSDPYFGYLLADNRRTEIPVDDDLMNILMDGVEIDERLIEDVDDAIQAKDTLEYGGRRLSYESVEDSIPENSEMDNDYEHVVDLQSLKDSIETRSGVTQYPKKMRFLKEFQEENVKKESETSDVRELEVHSDKLRDDNSNVDDDFLENDIKSHSYELKANLAEKVYSTPPVRGSKANSDELKDNNTKNEDEIVQNIETKAFSDALKDMRANKNYIFSGIRGSETHKILQNSETKSYLHALTDKHTTKKYLFSRIRKPKIYFDKINDEIAQKEDDIMQANDIKFNSDGSQGKHDKKDYVTSQIRKSEIKSNKLNARKGDEVIDDSEIKFYVNALKNKHAKKRHDASEVIQKRKKYLDIENSRQKNKVNLQDESTEIFNFKEFNEITDHIASKPTYPIKLRSQTYNEDGLQDSDITFD